MNPYVRLSVGWMVSRPVCQNVKCHLKLSYGVLVFKGLNVFDVKEYIECFYKIQNSDLNFALFGMIFVAVRLLFLFSSTTQESTLSEQITEGMSIRCDSIPNTDLYPYPLTPTTPAASSVYAGLIHLFLTFEMVTRLSYHNTFKVNIF